jgi:hypothetical protein
MADEPAVTVRHATDADRTALEALAAALQDDGKR